MASKETPVPASADAAVKAAEASLSGPLSPTSPLSATTFPPPPAAAVLSPCAACKILRRRCMEGCLLAPYFPPTDPLKFTIAHRVFGASNIIKLLQELPEFLRSDAVSSIVYEANTRLRYPVYGCTGIICQLQKQINELQVDLAKAQAEILNFKYQNECLSEFISKNQEMVVHDICAPQDFSIENSAPFLDETILGVGWEPLWA